MRDVLVAAAALALLAVLEAAFYGVRYLQDRRTEELRRRLRAIGKDGALDSALLRRGRFANSPALDRLLRGVPVAARLEALLEQADSRLTVAQLVGIAAGAGAAGLAAGAVFSLGAPAALALAASGVVLPALMLLAARSRRSRALSEQLPEALDMMARSLRAGHALPSAFQVVAGEMPPPVSIEFARAFEEQKLGLTLERAVQQMSARAPNNGDLKIFAVSAVVQKETGGNLAEILQTIATTIRDRYKFYGKLKALTAEGRVSAIILAILPIAVSVILSTLNPSYLERLFDNALGQKILAGAIVSWIAGVVWMQRLARLEF